MRSLIGVLAGCSSLLALVLAAVVIVQRRAARALRKLACSEPLTGLANRREFIRVLDSEISRTSRTGRPFSVVAIDVDRLKLINDRFGHRAGNRAIRRVANAIRVSCRVTDVAARIGGDEFAVILPEATDGEARQFLARVHAVLARHTRGGVVSISGGVAEHPRDGLGAEPLLDIADRALYVDKRRRERSTPASIPRLVPGAQRQIA